MQVFARSIMARITLSFVAFWLGAAGTARAGGGGADLAAMQTLINKGLCPVLGMDTAAGTCPQLPTLTQAVLEIAGLENAPPDTIRSRNGITPTVAINAVNPPAGSPFALPNLTPLAFVSAPGSIADVTELGESSANSFFYAALDGAEDTQTTLHLVYDYLPLKSLATFAKGGLVAQFSIPLVINTNTTTGSETEAPTTIKIFAASGGNCSVPCFSATATGSFVTPTGTVTFGPVDPAKLGLTVAFGFKSSPNLTDLHAVFEVQAPLLVNSAHDPAYFPPGTASGTPPLIEPDFIQQQGFTSKLLGSPIGIAPFAAPLCASGGKCPPVTTSYPYCANIAGSSAVATFLAISTVGVTYVSAPLTPSSTCPF